ncbi:hypothetical protein M1N79_03085 [Dehalococcoidia bacterium]|nr:hypothetical protein [Dehalococcoidia bacterium]
MDTNHPLRFGIETLAKEMNINTDQLLYSTTRGIILGLGIGPAEGFRILQWSTGKQSAVYKVTLPNGKNLCLKLVGTNKDNVHLRREGCFSRLLRSKHFPRLIINAASEGFIVEEWIEGLPFNFADGSFLLRNLKLIAENLSQALQDLTTATPAVIHRDIKPVHSYIHQGRVVVTDFGSAEHEGARAPVQPDSFPKLGRGTHVFQPFEQLTSQPTQDPRVDVFAVASIIFTIMEGRPPYDNAQSGYVEALDYYKNKERRLFQALKNHSPRLQTALFDALRVDPEDRSTDIWAVVNALE